MTEVFTAVSLNDDNMDRPLLESDMKNNGVVTSKAVAKCYFQFRMHGMIIGFLVQVVNVAGTSLMYYQWQNQGVFSKVSTDIVGTFLHAMVWLLTQVDLYLYLFMWAALTAILTQPGMQYVVDNYFGSSKDVNKRSIFVLGVQFYMGVVVGVFLAWTTIDVVLGLPVPILPMSGVLFFGLCISCTMIWCYDLEDTIEEKDAEDEESRQTPV